MNGVPQRKKSAGNPGRDRLPPHAPEAEQGVLGCILLEPLDCWNTCEEAGLTPDWFYDLRHGTIFNAMHQVLAGKRELDVIALVSWLTDHGQLEQVGGVTYVSVLPDTVPSARNLPTYLEILRAKFMARSTLRVCTEAAVAIYEDGAEPEKIVGELERSVLRIAEETTAESERAMKQLVPELMAELEDYHRGHAQIRGLTTGIEYNDKLLCGLGGKHGNYIVLSGRPGTGKTSLATQIALHAALDFVWFEPVEENGQVTMVERKGVPVAVFTMEMARNALAYRMLFQRAKADMQRWRTGFAESADYEPLAAKGIELSKCDRLLIDDTGRCSVDTLRARARRLHRQYGIKLFVIDYIQLMRGSRRKREDRVAELTEISAEIQGLGKELQVPFIVLAQMNRDFEKDPNRPPRLADLKDCGSIEQDADLVGFLYTPKKAHEKPQYIAAMNAVYGQDWSKAPVRVNLLWAKNRYGPCGVAELLFQRSCTLFHDYGRWLKDHGQRDAAAGESKPDLVEQQDEDGLPSNEELGME